MGAFLIYITPWRGGLFKARRTDSAPPVADVTWDAGTTWDGGTFWS